MLQFCEHYKKYRNLNRSPSVEVPPKRTVSADPWAVHLNICANCPPKENLHTRKLEEITALYAVEATFAIIYSCLLFSAGLNF